MARTHGSKEMNNLLKDIKKAGFTVERLKNGVFIITPPSHIKAPSYKTHGTLKAIKPIKADFRKMYGVEL
jgi:hypothetical protein